MSLINKSKVKKFSLDEANKLHKHKLKSKSVDSSGREWDMARCNLLHQEKRFTQISKDFLEDVEADVRNLIKKKLKSMPLSGKTIK
jgi:Zn-finger protein